MKEITLASLKVELLAVFMTQFFGNCYYYFLIMFPTETICTVQSPLIANFYLKGVLGEEENLKRISVFLSVIVNSSAQI